MRSTSQPVCLSFTLCEAVVRDLDSGRQAIVGTLDHVFVDQCPARGLVFTAFFEVTGVLGLACFEIRLLKASDPWLPFDLRGFDALASWRIPDRFVPDEADVATVAAGLGGAAFPEFGDYWFVLFLNDAPLLARRFGLRSRRVS